MHLRDDGSVHHGVVRHDPGAAERACLVEPAGSQRVEKQRARQFGRRGLCSSQRVGLERTEQRRCGRAAPEASCFERDGAPGHRFGPRGRLDLDVQRVAVAQAERGDRFEARQRFAGVAAAVPAARVEPRERGPILIAGDPLAVARAPQRRVMQQKWHAIGAQLHVALERTIAVARA